MANLVKQKAKLQQRIDTLETELKTSLQKKVAGPAINIVEYTNKIKELRAQLAKM